MSKNATRIIALLIAVALVGGFIYFQSDLINSKKEKSTAEESTPEAAKEAPQAPATPVKAVRVTGGSLKDYILVNGSTMPNEKVTITSEVPGKIERINFREGTYVKAGRVLVYLEDSELQAQRKRLVVQEELNQKIAERLKALYDKEGVSLQEYEVAKAEVEKVTAEIALLDAQLEKKAVKAPFSGQLGLRQVSEGGYLSPGDPIVNLVSINPIKLEFSVPEKYSREVQQGTKVTFKMDGQEQSTEATVIATEPNIDPETRSFRLKASAPNPGGKMLPGAFAKVSVNLRQYDKTIMVPTEAIIPELGGKKVFIYSNGIAQSVSVETGIRQESSIQVLSGLEEGDTLITTGVLQIRSGSPVNITSLD